MAMQLLGACKAQGNVLLFLMKHQEALADPLVAMGAPVVDVVVK